MARKRVVLCDTNVIIEFYKNNFDIVETLKNIGQENIAISTITAGELIFGALNKKELSQIVKDINHLGSIPVNEKISDIFLDILTRYALSHKLSLPDGFIAATAIYSDIELYTLNHKDFRFIKGLKLFKE